MSLKKLKHLRAHFTSKRLCLQTPCATTHTTLNSLNTPGTFNPDPTPPSRSGSKVINSEGGALDATQNITLFLAVTSPGF